MPTVGVVLADYDSCFSFRHTQGSHSYLADFEKGYQAVKQELMAYKYKYDKILLMSSSNRQDLGLDIVGAQKNHNGLSFQNLPMLAKHLGFESDPFLLADIEPTSEIKKFQAYFLRQGLNVLTTPVSPDKYRELGGLIGKYFTNKFPYSSDKLPQLYAAAHRQALAHPDDKIHIHIYDDLNERVLSPLKIFFSKYSELLPANCEVHFHHLDSWDNRTATNEGYVQGKGEVDKNYMATINKMETHSRSQSVPASQKRAYTSFVTPELLGYQAKVFKDSKATMYQQLKEVSEGPAPVVSSLTRL